CFELLNCSLHVERFSEPSIRIRDDWQIAGGSYSPCVVNKLSYRDKAHVRQAKRRGEGSAGDIDRRETGLFDEPGNEWVEHAGYLDGSAFPGSAEPPAGTL